MLFKLLALLQWHLNLALDFTLADELNVVFLDQLLLTAVLFQLGDLLLFGLIVLDLLRVEVGLHDAGLQEIFLFLQSALELLNLVRVLILGGTCFTTLMHHDYEPDNVKLLLIDTVLVEKSLLVQLQETLLKLILDVDDFLPNVFESEFPGFSLLFLEFLLFDEELPESCFFVFTHLLLRLGHPLFADKLLVHRVLFFLESQLTIHHDF